MIRKESLHDKVVRHLALRILKGGTSTLPNEADLGDELQVSRSVLRESIKVLAAKGLLEVGPKTGTRVRPRKDWNLLDSQLLEWISETGFDEHFFDNICELRRIFEPTAAELAALRATPEDIAQIRSAWEDMRRNSHNWEGYNAADLRFHNAIQEAAHNELLSHVSKLSRVLLRISFAITSTSEERFSASLPLHRDVLDAVANGNPRAAKKYMEKVIAVSATGIRSRLGHEDRQPLAMSSRQIFST
jgi:GntR family galactonate operon transcriptional repressor